MKFANELDMILVTCEINNNILFPTQNIMK